MPARYRKLRKIADGGMAELFLAIQQGAEGFERRVVLKQILAPLLADPKFRNMLIDEAHVAMSLHHSNIAQVLDLGHSRGRYFLVLEFVDGWDLNQILARVRSTSVPLPPQLALYVTAEVCRALSYAHSRTRDGKPLGIVHRDISPHNVLVSFMGEVKITDFGIAKASSIMNKTAVGILKGKYGYMSPEQARGQPLDHRSDIFNTGIVLYELLVGERCFAGSSDFSTLNLMRNAVVTPPTKINSRVPKELETIVLKALSADRNDRFKDALEFEGALGNVLPHPAADGRVPQHAADGEDVRAAVD